MKRIPWAFLLALSISSYTLMVAPGSAADAKAAERYPIKPVRMVVPFAPGGGVEAQARIVSQKLTEALGQPVVIDGRPGAGGALGAQIVASSAPDGHTLLFTNAAFATLSSLSNRPLFDPYRDFTPVIHVGVQPQLLVAHPSMPATLHELLALARKQPGKLSFASAGVGAMSQLTVELLKSMAGVNIVHVPYKGSAPSVAAILSGEVHLAILGANVVMPHMRSGKLRALGITSAKRSISLPEVPTIAESGVPGYETTQWSAVLAPARTPRAVVTKLHAEIDRALKRDDVRQQLANLGVEPVGGTPEDFAIYLRADIARWERLIKETGLRAE